MRTPLATTVAVCACPLPFAVDRCGAAEGLLLLLRGGTVAETALLTSAVSEDLDTGGAESERESAVADLRAPVMIGGEAMRCDAMR